MRFAHVPQNILMDFKKFPWISVGADLSRPAPIYRPSGDVRYPDEKVKTHNFSRGEASKNQTRSEQLGALQTLAFLRSQKVAFEQPIEEGLRELWIIVDLLVEFEMAVDHALEQFIHHVVEGESGIFRWIHAHTGLKRRVSCKPLFYFPYAQLIIFREIRAEMLVKFLDNLR